MSAHTCLACGSGVAHRTEVVDAAVIAAAWTAYSPAFAAVDRTELLDRIVEDVGTAVVEIWKCVECGLEFADPARSWSAANYPVEEYAAGFDHLHALGILRETGHARLLELGCADGRFLEGAAALGHRVTGLDFSAGAVARARSRGLDVREAGVDALLHEIPQDGGFDVVAMFQLIEHLEEPDIIFEQIGAVAAPDAMLLVGTPSPLRYSRQIEHPERIGLSDFWDYPPQHTLRWTAQSLQRFLERHGWQVRESIAEPFSLRGAAAHICALHGHASAWYRVRWQRAVRTLRIAARLAATRATTPVTGIRLHTMATRGRPLPRR